jgi:hypothetical protein
MDEVDKKFKDFINLLEERTIHPIDNTDIKESCTATLLLLFAAVDSLSKITCSDKEFALYKENRGSNYLRFTSVLDKFMCNKYAIYKDPIYSLKNNMVHTGINTKVILTKSQHLEKHLQFVDEYLWINTNQFLDDFKKTIEKIKNNIDEQGKIYQNAKKRLKGINIIEVDEQNETPRPSPGPNDSFY